MTSILKTVRHRSRAHLMYVASKACCAGSCLTSATQAHHLTEAPGQPKARGLKTSDQWVVPLCAVHHAELHWRGDEAAWWRGRRVDPLPIARWLWDQSLLEGRAKA